MSLILAWSNENFIAVCCDGKAIYKHADGTITPAGENFYKLHSVAPRIVLAVAGDADLGPYLAKQAASVAQQLSGIPEEAFTFKALREVIPTWSRVFCQSRKYAVPQEHSVMLLGYDASLQRLRGVGWDSNTGFAPVEIPAGSLVIAGHEEGKQIADSLTNSLIPTYPEAAISELERIVREVGRLAPERVNSNTQSLVITAPSTTSAVPTFADANGNLLFKNVASGTPTTSAPSTTSATYVVIPEMTKTITTKGNKVFLSFWITVSPAGANAQAQFAFFRDGTQLTNDAEVDAPGTAGRYFLASLSYVDSVAAGSHTYEVRWRGVSGNLVNSLGTARQFQVVELG